MVADRGERKEQGCNREGAGKKHNRVETDKRKEVTGKSRGGKGEKQGKTRRIREEPARMGKDQGRT